MGQQRIVKCKGTDCPHKLNCLRYTAPNKQSSGEFIEVPYGKNVKNSVDHKALKYNCLHFVGNSHLKK